VKVKGGHAERLQDNALKYVPVKILISEVLEFRLTKNPGFTVLKY
jgi:hypothetical protein